MHGKSPGEPQQTFLSPNGWYRKRPRIGYKYFLHISLKFHWNFSLSMISMPFGMWKKLICIPSTGCPWLSWLTDFKDTSYIVPSVFQCVLDMDAGTLGFMADGQWLGTAFSGYWFCKNAARVINHYVDRNTFRTDKKAFKVKHFTQS